MTNLQDMDELLVAYADGELDEAAAAEVEDYLAVTPAAQRTLAIYRDTAALLRAAFPAGEDSGTIVIPPMRRPRQPYVWAAAACLAMGLVGYGAGAYWPGLIHSDRDHILSEVAQNHSIYSRETVHLVEVPASQTDHLKAWLGKRVNGTLVIPDFKAAGLTFAGGRLVVLDGEPVAELMYTRDNGLPIAFYVLSHGGKPDAVTVEQRGAINLATWDDGAHAYIVVGEGTPAMIRDLALLARKQL
jgi:anti-sigma factor RsiW